MVVAGSLARLVARRLADAGPTGVPCADPSKQLVPRPQPSVSSMSDTPRRCPHTLPFRWRSHPSPLPSQTFHFYPVCSAIVQPIISTIHFLLTTIQQCLIKPPHFFFYAFPMYSVQHHLTRLLHQWWRSCGPRSPRTVLPHYLLIIVLDTSRSKTLS